MGQFLSKEHKDAQVRKITDKVFDKFTAGSGDDKLSFQELYTAVLLVYNDINKRVPGPHRDPPSRVEVRELLQEFDTNHNGFLEKDEFAAFLHKFTKNVTSGITRSLLIYSAAPLLAFAAKRGTEQLPRVGPLVRRIPNFFYATLVTTALTFFGQHKMVQE